MMSSDLTVFFKAATWLYWVNRLLAMVRYYHSLSLVWFDSTVVAKIEVGADSISMHMLDIRSDHHPKEIIIDTAFNVVVNRP